MKANINSFKENFNYKAFSQRLNALNQKSSKKSNKTNNRFASFSWGKLSIKDQAFFAKRLSFLIKAGVPLLEALHMIREQTNNKRYAKVLDVVIEDVANGQSLSGSLNKFKNVFGDFAINIIAVGESTGILSENLNYLADELKKKQVLRKKVVGALVYPIFITIATLGITGLMTVYIFPKIMPIFASLNVTLPLSTRILVFTSNFLRHWGLVLILVIGIMIFGIMLAIKNNKKLHLFFDQCVLKIPFVGPMVQSYNLANISRTLGLLLKGGMTVSDALPITARSTANFVYRREFERLAVVVDRGEQLSSYLKNFRKLFPDILSQIISVGERSGNLPETLSYLSDMYEGEVEDATKNLSSLIEPVLMICMGLIVGFVAVSVITPIYGITQHLSPR